MGVNGEVAPPAGSLLGKKSALNPQGAKCQKCLQVGHWTYECKNKRKYVHRSSRTSMLNKRLNQAQNETQGIPSTNKGASTALTGKKKKPSGSESSSSSSDSESDSSSSEDSSDSSDSSSSDSSSSSSNSSSSGDSSSSSSSSSDSSENNSGDDSSVHQSTVAKKKSKDKLKTKQSNTRREHKKDQGRDKQTELDHPKSSDSNRSSRLAEKPVDLDKHLDKRKINQEEHSHDQRSFVRDEPEINNHDRQHKKRKRAHESSRSRTQDNSCSPLNDEDQTFKQSVTAEPRERYERRKNSSLYWSKSAEEEEKKLKALSEISKHQDNVDRERLEYDCYSNFSHDSEGHSGLQDDYVSAYKKKNKNDHEHWTGESQEDNDYLEESSHSQRFYENVEHRRRRKEQEPLVKNYYKEVKNHPESPIDMEMIKDNPEEENISSSYWSYEMERIKKRTQTDCDTERSPEFCQKPSHKRKKLEIEEYCKDMNGSKTKNAPNAREDKGRTDSNQYIPRKDDKNRHSESKSRDVKKRKSGKHAGRDLSSDYEKHIDYDDFDLQGRNELEDTPAYITGGSDVERYATGHNRKSKPTGKKMSIKYFDEGRPSSKHMKRLEISPERKRENRKSHHRNR